MFTRRLSLAIALALTAPGCKKSKPTEPVGPTEPATSTEREWSPGPDSVAKLGNEVDFGGYRIRPPAGYTQVPASAGVPGVTATAWVATRRPDGTAASLTVMIATPPPGEPLPSLEEGIQMALEGIRKRRTGWTEATERGRINGRVFLKGTWSGNEAQTGRAMRGFIYWTIQGGKVIQIGSQDLEPHAAETLPVADTAALTFQFPKNQ